MKPGRFYLIIFGVFIGLVLMVFLLWLLAPIVFSWSISSPISISGAIGSYGPVQIRFPVKMDPLSVESRFTTIPETSGRFKWVKNDLFFFPDMPFDTGRNLRIELVGVLRTLNGIELKVNRQWIVKVRENRIIYLANPNSAPEIYISSKDGFEKIPLTSTGGAVKSFTVSLEGTQVIYSVKNKEGGADLWLLNIHDRTSKLTLACGIDQCTDPEWSNLSSLLVYHRWRAKSVQPLTYNPPQLWILDLKTGETEELFPAESVNPRQTSWSPSGDMLAVSDLRNQGIRLLDFSTKREYFIQAREGWIGNWTTDGKYLFFSRNGSTESTPGSSVARIQIESKEVSLVVDGENEQVEFGVPAVIPDGKWIAIGSRLPGRGSAKQIWLYGQNGEKQMEVTSDPVYTYANIHWDSGGKYIVAQRFHLGSSRNTPQIIVWNREENSFTIIADDGAMPKWIP